MRMPFKKTCFGLSALCLVACNLGDVLTTAQDSVIPTEQEIVSGLIQSLVVGMTKGSNALSAKDGFFGNNLIKVPFPQEAKHVQSALTKLGAGQIVNNTTLALNRAAEDASGVAKEVLVSAIQSMTIKDATQILLGPNNAATTYLKTSTSNLLLSKFKPIIGNSLDKVHATKHWSDIMTRYNQANVIGILGKPIETDLTQYVASRALDGLFHMVEQEEASIRTNPLERSTNLLKKVFGYADSKK